MPKHRNLLPTSVAGSWIILLIILLTPAVQRARAEDTTNLEYPVKAAMLFNFTQFVEWPKEAFAAADSPIVIGVAGDANPFANSLEQVVAGKKVAGRSIVIKYKVDADSAGACQMLFVPASADGLAASILQKVGAKPVFSVGETEAFMKVGGIARFYTEANKVHFEMNPAAADRAGLKISSKLLKLARIYKQ